MKRTLKNIVIGILMVALILGTVAMAEIDLSGMTAEELKALISDAGTVLQNMKPVDDNCVMVEEDGHAIVSISSIEADEKYGGIRINLLMINDKNSELSFLFDKVIINGWEVKTGYGDVFITPNSKSKAGYLRISNIYELSDISSLEEIESIETYGTLQYNGEFKKVHYLMTYDRNDGLKILQCEITDITDITDIF